MEKLLVISSYPEKNLTHGKATVGVASYAKNTLNAIKDIAGKKTDIIVLAEKLQNDKNHTQNGVKVKRIWKRGTFNIFPVLLKTILTHHKDTKHVLVELELAMFGSLLYLLPLPAFLLILRLFGKNVIVVCHQVIPNITQIGPHININGESLKTTFINIAIRGFYFALLLLSSKIIVFEDALKTKLSKFGSPKKIKVISHGVETFTNIPTKSAARKRLGIRKDEFVAVSFGYIAWYKGSDWIVNAISEINNKSRGRKVSLILAGGENPNHLDKKYYIKYLRTLTQKASENNIRITGYVPQKDIAYYYQAADVILFPYKTFMSASGPLSLALSFSKPFLISPRLKPALSTKDIQNGLRIRKLSEDEISFKDFNGDFSKKIKRINKDIRLRKKLSLLSSDIQKERRWSTIGGKYYEEIFN